LRCEPSRAKHLPKARSAEIAQRHIGRQIPRNLSEPHGCFAGNDVCCCDGSPILLYFECLFVSWLAGAAALDGKEHRKFFPEMPKVIVCVTRRTRTLQVHERAGRVSARNIDGRTGVSAEPAAESEEDQ
jgi:hypothetical protein